MAKKKYSLGEVEPGSEVVVAVRSKKTVYEQATKLHTVSGNTIFFEPMFEDGKLLDFLTAETKCDIYWKNQGRTIVFKGVNIPLGYSSALQRRTQCCSTEVVGDEINHRSTQRHNVNRYCLITKGQHKGTTEAYLKDVSLGGFAVTAKSYEVTVGDEIHVALELPDERKLYLTGNVVRLASDGRRPINGEEETILMGCTAIENQKAFMDFVMQAERDLARKLRGKL